MSDKDITDINKLIDDFVADYEVYDEDTSAVYSPNEFERAMITDALHGFVANHWPDETVAAIRRAALEEAAAHLDALAAATPLGHEDKQRGASTYNWLRTHAAAIRALKDKEPGDDQ